MLKLTFKNVGQGDSIILEWDSPQGSRIGIIDCNQNNGNPILRHIKKTCPLKIDFIVLSHPHYDHFSGMLELFEYCSEKNIKIERFLHTSYLTTDFIRSALNTVQSEKNLLNLFKYINKTYIKSEMEVGFIQADGFELFLKLSESSRLTFLTPQYQDFLSFMRVEKFNVQEEEAHNNPKANILSTICMIETKKGYVLLTADSTIKQLNRIQKKLEGKLVLGQSPHHGSGANHAANFWHNIKRIDKTPIIFSVGKNRYGHPGHKAVRSFIKNGYKLFSTDPLGISSSKNISKRSEIMNPFTVDTSFQEGGNNYGEKIFEFEI